MTEGEAGDRARECLGFGCENDAMAGYNHCIECATGVLLEFGRYP